LITLFHYHDQTIIINTGPFRECVGPYIRYISYSNARNRTVLHISGLMKHIKKYRHVHTVCGTIQFHKPQTAVHRGPTDRTVSSTWRRRFWQPTFAGLNLVVAAVLHDSVCVSLLPCVADCCVSCCIVYVRLSGLSQPN